MNKANTPSKVWGISCGHHDGALAVVQGSDLVYASHSERYSKIKNDPKLHRLQIEEALRFGLPEAIYYYEKPWLKALRSFWSGEWALLRANALSELKKSLCTITPELGKVPMYTTSHHLSHAAAGFYTSGFQDALIVVCDAIGEIDTLSIYQARDGVILPKPLFTLRYPDSLGLFYSAATKAVGLKPNEDEFILMGMAAYGDASEFANILQNFVSVDLKSSFPKWTQKVNVHRGLGIDYHNELDQMNFAAAVQKQVEKYILALFADLHQRFQQNTHWVFAGGVALNCTLNSNIVSSLPAHHRFFIFPNPGDAGSALGAILAHKKTALRYDHCFWGTTIQQENSDEWILKDLQSIGMCGLARGRAEFGPRALGQRSLLADPTKPQIKDLLNTIKQRQKFRPFAAAVLEEHAQEHFTLPGSLTQSRFMQFVAQVKNPHKFSSITHVDGTCRIQTVDRETNPQFHALLTKWYRASGVPFLMNTSLNIRSQPIVNDQLDGREFANKYQVRVFN